MPLYPPPPPWQAARGPRPCLPSSLAHPPWVYTGRRAVVGAGRGPVGRRWVSAGGGGGGKVSSLWPATPPSPGGHQSGPPRLPISGRHRAVAAHGAGAEPLAGSRLRGSERAADRGRLARGRVRRGCGVPPLGGWGERGEGGRGGGGGTRCPPPAPGPPPRWPRGVVLVVPVPGGQPLAGRGVLFPRLPSALGCRALAQALARVPAFAAQCRLAAGGGEWAGVCWGWWFGQWSAVSGLWGSGPPLALGAPVLPSTGGGVRPSAALYGGGAVRRGALLCWGGRPAALSPVPPPVPIA